MRFESGPAAHERIGWRCQHGSERDELPDGRITLDGAVIVEEERDPEAVMVGRERGEDERAGAEHDRFWGRITRAGGVVFRREGQSGTAKSER